MGIPASIGQKDMLGHYIGCIRCEVDDGANDIFRFLPRDPRGFFPGNHSENPHPRMGFVMGVSTKVGAMAFSFHL